MKKIFFLLAFLCVSLVSIAQRDSIKVVIECDSLYRPFLECGYLDIKFGLGNQDRYRVALNSNLSFDIPLPKYKTYIVSIRGTSFQTAFLFLNSKDSILNEKKLSFPPSCKYNKFLVDNTCEQCTLNDSVTWIQFGIGMYESISEETYRPKICNPYRNPINSKGYSAGCAYDAVACRAHWYCHRCKKEY